MVQFPESNRDLTNLISNKICFHKFVDEELSVDEEFGKRS